MFSWLKKCRMSRVGLVLCGLACSGTLMAQPPNASDLPEPYATKSAIHFPKVIGWPEGRRPEAPQGFEVRALAELENPRWIYVLPGGDLLVAQSRTLPKPESGDEGNQSERKAGDKAQKQGEKAARDAKSNDKQDDVKSKEDKSKEDKSKGDNKKGDDQDKGDKEKEQKLNEGMKKSKTVTGSSPNRISLIRDSDGDGKPELVTTFHEGLHQPFGMALVGDKLFVAATDGLWAFQYEKGQTKLSGEGEKILDLPAGGYNNHWTRNVLASRDGKKLYVSVGSASNVAEHGTAEEMLRANVLELNLDGTGLRVFASGLRNPVGMAWRPDSDELWVAVNERDELGDELVPDYLTSVKEDGFYGWPYSYWGDHADPRLKGKRMDLVKKAIVPDVDLGSHTASLGLAFYEAKAFPEKYRGGAFVGQRGSWNRSKFAGYRVAFVPFRDGKPSGEPEDFLTGFIANENEVYGRPVGVAVDARGALLVADEPANVIWRVTYKTSQR